MSLLLRSMRDPYPWCREPEPVTRGTRHIGTVWTMPDRHVRASFSAQLEDIERLVMRQFGLVIEGIAGATTVLLGDDHEAARALIARDEIIDDLEYQIEETVEQQLLLEAPVARDFRFLMTVSRIVPELERSGDLAEHIAAEAARGFGRELTPSLRGSVQDMGDIAGTMWRRAADAFRDHDGEAGAELDVVDDELDVLHRGFVDEAASVLVGEAVSSAALVGRYYERLGDHAVNIARRITYLATGRPQHDRT
jgi:phosphate transport system protein